MTVRELADCATGLAWEALRALRRYVDGGMRIASYHFTWAPRQWTRPTA